jgi:hypothetical protein
MKLLLSAADFIFTSVLARSAEPAKVASPETPAAPAPAAAPVKPKPKGCAACRRRRTRERVVWAACAERARCVAREVGQTDAGLCVHSRRGLAERGQEQPGV